MKNNTLLVRILGSGFLFLSVFACKTEENKNSTENTPAKAYSEAENMVKADSLLLLRTNEKQAWDSLANLEADKISNINRLIEEIAFNTSSNPIELKKAKSAAQQIETLVLKREDIADASKIINDEINDSLIVTIFEIGSKTPNMDNYPLFNELMSEIQNQNIEMVVKQRTVHSNAAAKLNLFIETNKDQLKALNLDIEPVSNWTE